VGEGPAGSAPGREGDRRSAIGPAAAPGGAGRCLDVQTSRSLVARTAKPGANPARTGAPRYRGRGPPVSQPPLCTRHEPLRRPQAVGHGSLRHRAGVRADASMYRPPRPQPPAPRNLEQIRPEPAPSDTEVADLPPARHRSVHATNHFADRGRGWLTSQPVTGASMSRCTDLPVTNRPHRETWSKSGPNRRSQVQRSRTPRQPGTALYTPRTTRRPQAVGHGSLRQRAGVRADASMYRPLRPQPPAPRNLEQIPTKPAPPGTEVADRPSASHSSVPPRTTPTTTVGRPWVPAAPGRRADGRLDVQTSPSPTARTAKPGANPAQTGAPKYRGRGPPVSQPQLCTATNHTCDHRRSAMGPCGTRAACRRTPRCTDLPVPNRPHRETWSKSRPNRRPQVQRSRTPRQPATALYTPRTTSPTEGALG
jgi:hypothetical protein